MTNRSKFDFKARNFVSWVIRHVELHALKIDCSAFRHNVLIFNENMRAFWRKKNVFRPFSRPALKKKNARFHEAVLSVWQERDSEVGGLR